VRIQSADKLDQWKTQRRECNPLEHQVQIPKTGIQKSRRNPAKDRTTPWMNYSVLEVYKLGPRMELSRDELHSYDDGNYSKGV
jgi:hypothetical protein